MYETEQLRPDSSVTGCENGEKKKRSKIRDGSTPQWVHIIIKRSVQTKITRAINRRYSDGEGQNVQRPEIKEPGAAEICVCKMSCSVSTQCMYNSVYLDACQNVI